MEKCKLLSELFFEHCNYYKQTDKEKIFIQTENNSLSYLDSKEICCKIIDYLITHSLLKNNFCIVSKNPTTIILTYLAFNFLGKDISIINPSNIVNLKNENYTYICDLILQEKENYISFERFIESKQIVKTKQNCNNQNSTQQLNSTFIRNNNLPLLIQFTSGTTSTPKKIIRTVESCYTEGKDLTKIWSIDRNSKVACFTPFSYSFAFGNVVISALTAGATIITNDNFNIANLVNTLTKNQATHFITVVSIIKLLLLQRQKTSLSFMKYIICSGSKILIKDAKKFEKKYHHAVSEQYGQTEFGSIMYSYKVNGTFTNFFPSVDTKIENSVLFVRRQNCGQDFLNTKDYIQKLKNGHIKILGRSDSEIKIDDKRYNIDALITLFENNDFLTISKSILSYKKICLYYTNDKKKQTIEISKKLKKLDKTIKIRRVRIK